jgi:hypothetical protein
MRLVAGPPFSWGLFYELDQASAAHTCAGDTVAVPPAVCSRAGGGQQRQRVFAAALGVSGDAEPVGMQQWVETLLAARALAVRLSSLVVRDHKDLPQVVSSATKQLVEALAVFRLQQPSSIRRRNLKPAEPISFALNIRLCFLSSCWGS